MGARDRDHRHTENLIVNEKLGSQWQFPQARAGSYSQHEPSGSLGVSCGQWRQSTWILRSESQTRLREGWGPCGSHRDRWLLAPIQHPSCLLWCLGNRQELPRCGLEASLLAACEGRGGRDTGPSPAALDPHVCPLGKDSLQTLGPCQALCAGFSNVRTEAPREEAMGPPSHTHGMELTSVAKRESSAGGGWCLAHSAVTGRQPAVSIPAGPQTHAPR